MNFNGPEAAEILVNDIKFLETVKKQKLEMINILEAKIIQDEDEYLDLSLHRHGNVFNAWKEIKQWNAQGIGAGPGGGGKKR